MKVSCAQLGSDGTLALMTALQSAGYIALFVGGCVRNAILGEAVRDIDITTDALPEAVTRIAMQAHFKALPTGIDHGTVTVLAGGMPHEVTTMRKDVQTDGRHAVVVYSSSVAEDAARRDFTMNALYLQTDGTVLDPLGGLPDLLARHVRFVGDAETRITEDYLRILRFFRFHAIYGDPAQGIDADGLAACAAQIAGIETLSRERVGAEFRKLLSAPDPAPAVAAMEQAGVLGQVLPGASARLLPILVHLEQRRPRGWLCRLAVIGGQNAVTKLRLNRAETRILDQICAEIGTGHGPAALGWRHGAELASDIVHARAALLESMLPADWESDAVRGAMASFPVAAADLMPELQGPALGTKLRELQDMWFQSGLSLTRDQLLA